MLDRPWLPVFFLCRAIGFSYGAIASKHEAHDGASPRRQCAGRGRPHLDLALNDITLPFVIALADTGYRAALGQDPHLRAGLNVHEGRITYTAVTDALKLPYVAAEEALEMQWPPCSPH